MSNSPASIPTRREPTAQEFIEMRDSAQFKELRGAYRNFTFPMTIAFFVWYVVYVLAAVFAPDLMGTEARRRLERRPRLRYRPVRDHLRDYLDLR